ncbi:MAG: DUF1232 domain-containing protein [Cyclobacteriaceae bacterium]|nr:DUF1232 domain-containing protein [Cyclobacteriaceae bacterium]
MRSTFHFNNPILNAAKNTAGNLISNRYRLMTLLGQLGKKVNSIEDKKRITTEVKEKIFVLGRLLRAFATGRYKALPWKASVSIIAATIYFINPADIIPDIIPFTGLVDDFGILVWTYNSLESELIRFIEWEKVNSFQQ